MICHRYSSMSHHMSQVSPLKIPLESIVSHVSHLSQVFRAHMRVHARVRAHVFIILYVTHVTVVTRLFLKDFLCHRS